MRPKVFQAERTQCMGALANQNTPEATTGTWSVEKGEFACDPEFMETAGHLHGTHNTELHLKEPAKEIKKKKKRKLGCIRNRGVFKKKWKGNSGK